MIKGANNGTVAKIRRDYTLLEPKIIHKKELNEKELQAMREAIASIEVQEPPVKKGLADYIHNEVLRVSGYKEDDPGATYTHVSLLKRLAPNIF